jgi:serine/threonine-protein kinase
MRPDDFDVPCANCSPFFVARRPDGATLQVRIERTLAEGGIGVVHAARTAGGRPVAVKVQKPQHARDPGLGSRFEREIHHALQIRHPNVVSALAAGRLSDDQPFLVMERLRGPTLGALVRAEGPLSIERALRFADQILAGLEAIHAAGLVHRDLQPGNVVVTRAPAAVVERGERGERAVIIDLGFAQEPGLDTGDGHSPDSSGSLVGTLTFMAPEQATRGRAITPQSDLFSTAVLIYFALTGRVPFRGRDDREALVSVVRDAPIPLRRFRPDAPAELWAVLRRALAKHPEARFAGAGAMRAALARVALAAVPRLRPGLHRPRANAAPRSVASAA